METVFSILHVVGAVFIVGPMAIVPMTGLRAVRSGDGKQATALAHTATIFGYLSLIVVLFGFALFGADAEKDKLSITTPWIWISILCYVIALALILALVAPALRRAGAQLTKGETVAASTYPRISAGAGIASLLLLAVVVLMVWRP